MAIRTASELLGDLVSRMARVERRLARVGGGAVDSAMQLPPPQVTIRNGASAVTATAFAQIVGTTPITIDLLADAWVTVTMGGWLAVTVAATDLRAGVQVSGALNLIPSEFAPGVAGGWGQVLIKSGYTGTEQASLTKTILVPAGVTTFTPVAQASTGSPGINYCTLQVTPLYWATV